MNQYASIFLGFAMIAASTAPVWAGPPRSNWFQAKGQEICSGYHKNVMWPWPDVCPDRSHARAPFNVMIQNGWRRQNLLGSHHFNAGSGELTTSGELKVHWVLTQAPMQYRQLFIERSLDSDLNAERLANVRMYAAKVALDGESPIVQETHLMAEGRPAAIVDFINVSFQESMPAPVLKETDLGQSE